MAMEKVIKFRATKEEERRLAALAQLTGENPSEIMRKLIRTAQIVQRPAVEAGLMERVSA